MITVIVTFIYYVINVDTTYVKLFEYENNLYRLVM